MNPRTVPAAPTSDRVPSAARPAPGFVRGAFHVAGVVAPGLVGGFIAKKMFSPRRRSPTSPPTWPPPEERRVPFRDGELAVYEWDGKGPHVLLVHGWEGRASDWGTAVGALRDLDFRITAFDCPAHGSSPGAQTDVHEIAAAIGEVVLHSGQPAAIVAHSIGAAATAVYVGELAEQRAERLVLVSPGGDLATELSMICAALGLGYAAQRALQGRVEARYGRPVESCSTRRALTEVELPILLLHDEADQIVPVEESQRLAAEHEGVELVCTTGLGHRRILRDPACLARISAFLDRG